MVNLTNPAPRIPRGTLTHAGLLIWYVTKVGVIPT